ncbi:MAG: efflux RND transporter periplasmic adaptor subunit [Caulobacteraceae bacterium]|nr:efflux RND transporter periplasmic adaptor subunit [Caulobacteraceae bacterium]
MRFRNLVWAVCLAAVAFGAYTVWRPETADRWAPPVAGVAHGMHDRIWPQQPQTAEAGKPKGPPPINVTAVAAKRADFPIVLQSLGQVQAYNMVTVRARVDGQIMRIAFNEGQMVNKGDLLAEIDPRPFQAALDQAKAKRVQDAANLANARLDLARYQALSKQSFVTQQQLDTQSALVNQLTAAVAADEAAIDAAQVQLNYTTIAAPISGRVGYRLVDEGNLVSAAQQTGIVTIAQIEPIAVIFTEPQEYVDKINAELAHGPLVTTVMDATGKTLATGKLIVSDNQVDLQTGTIRLKAEFDNKDHALWPGVAVTVGLQIGVDRDAVVVPAEAVQHGPNGLFVYVVDDNNRADVRQVKVAHQNTTEAVIAEGVKEGEKVVTNGAFQLQPGAVVAIQAPSGS